MSSQRLHRFVKLVTGLALVVAGTSGAAISGSEQASGTLSMNASLVLSSQIGACTAPPGADDCAARTISGQFSGLGTVTGKYEFLVKTEPPPCAADLGKALGYPIHFTVAGKGELHAAVADAPCVDSESIRTQAQSFTINGGTGIYAGATGRGTLERALGEPTDSGRHGLERWTGTLNVPGLDFDVVQPALSGAANKTARARKGAKTARVAFSVTAQDDRDGAVPVTCDAKSGSRFRLGRTRVTCSATDTSANSASASFTITVKKGR